MAAVIVAFSILSVTEVEAKSKKKYRLSYTSKTMEQGELYNISLKGVPKSVAGALREIKRHRSDTVLTTAVTFICSVATVTVMNIRSVPSKRH